MRAIKVEFHRLADKEYEEARAYYAERSPDTATRFAKAVDAAARRIAEAPESMLHRGSVSVKELRKLVQQRANE